jgi:hypothetical protein
MISHPSSHRNDPVDAILALVEQVPSSFDAASLETAHQAAAPSDNSFLDIDSESGTQVYEHANGDFYKGNYRKGLREGARTDPLKLAKCDKDDEVDAENASAALPPSSPKAKAIAHGSKTAMTVALLDSKPCNQEDNVSDTSLVVRSHPRLQCLEHEPMTSHESQAANPSHGPRSFVMLPDYVAKLHPPSRMVSDWLVTGDHHAKAQMSIASNDCEATCTADNEVIGAVQDPKGDINGAKQHVVVQRVVNGPFGSIREASRSSIAFVSNASAAAYIAAMQKLQARRQQLDGD